MYIGIDLGTSGLKAIVIDKNGVLLASESVPLRVSSAQDLWSEQNPQHWWTALNKAMLKLNEQCDLSQVVAIGLAGQMHGATLLDKGGEVIRPCMLWNDGRSVQECRELYQLK